MHSEVHPKEILECLKNSIRSSLWLFGRNITSTLIIQILYMPKTSTVFVKVLFRTVESTFSYRTEASIFLYFENIYEN